MVRLRIRLRPRLRLRLRVGVGVGVGSGLGLEEHGRAEVDELDVRRVALRHQHEVLRLEVAVHLVVSSK